MKASSLRIGILCYDENSRSNRIQIELFHSLIEQGHTSFLASKTLEGMRLNLERIACFVKETKADGWIVFAGSRQVLEWFTQEKIPVFAAYGSHQDLPIAAMKPNYEPALRAAVGRLIELGHSRIVAMTHRGRHENGPERNVRIILEEMEAHGVPWGSYNYPCWEKGKDGFWRCLESLFEHTPPSALIIEEGTYLFATLQFCLDRKLQIPDDISLICAQHPPSFDFARPRLAHIAWDYRPMVRRMVLWADNIARGKTDTRKTKAKAKFVDGGTIGPAAGIVFRK